MPDPIRIPLSRHQRARFSVLQAEQKAATDKFNESLTAIVSGIADPAALVAERWSIRVTETEIVCTPPETPTKPTLVPDIGPDGVSASAAAG